MTLLETIRALDAPYVVWLNDLDFFQAAAAVWFPKDYQFGQSYWCSRSFVRRNPIVPSDHEIDALLAQVGT